MPADRLKKVLGPKIFMDFQRIIEMSLTSHICSSRSIGIVHKSDYKVVEPTRNL